VRIITTVPKNTLFLSTQNQQMSIMCIYFMLNYTTQNQQMSIMCIDRQIANKRFKIRVKSYVKEI